MTLLFRSQKTLHDTSSVADGAANEKLRAEEIIKGSISGRRLLTTLVDESPTGINIRFSDRKRDLYYKLKDARSAARNEERNLVPGEALRLSSTWSDVSALAFEALETVTKDLEILAWLAEAELRLNGFAGLRDVFRATTVLVDQHFDALHSIDGDGVEDKVAPFAGLNGVGAEGTLIQPLRLTPLTPDAPFFELTLWEFQTSQRPGEEGRRFALRDAVASAGTAAMQDHLGAATDCLDAFLALNAAFDARCGAHAPPASNIRGVLEEIRLAIFNLTGFTEGNARPRLVERAAEQAGAETPAAAATDGAPSAQRQWFSDEIASRDEAFDLLLKVARFFRAAEPHSPISMSIETLVARGRMDFAELLQELITDESTRRSILVSAGIRPQSESPK